MNSVLVGTYPVNARVVVIGPICPELGLKLSGRHDQRLARLRRHVDEYLVDVHFARHELNARVEHYAVDATSAEAHESAARRTCIMEVVDAGLYDLREQRFPSLRGKLAGGVHDRHHGHHIQRVPWSGLWRCSVHRHVVYRAVSLAPQASQQSQRMTTYKAVASRASSLHHSSGTQCSPP